MAKKTQTVSVATIAQHLGISRSTAYFALAGNPNISKAMQERVSLVAEELGYRPNLMARGLRSKRTGVIGAITPSLYNSLEPLLQSATLSAGEHSYNTLYACTLYDHERERAMLDLLLGMGVDGLIILTLQEDNTELFARITSQVPVVFIDKKPAGLPVDVVGVDQREIGRRAAEYLLSLGRRHLVFIEATAIPSRQWWIRARCEGCDSYMRQAGCGTLSILSLPVSAEPTHAQDPAFVVRALRDYLEAGGEVDAVIGANDIVARGAMQALTAMGRRIPEDVAVTGVDNVFSTAGMGIPPLTSFIQPMAKVGEEAIRLLIQRIRGDQTLPFPQERFLPPELMIRASTDPTARDK